MGFEIYLQRIRDDDCNTFPLKCAETILDRGALAPSRMIHVDYPDGKATIICSCQNKDACGCADRDVWGCRAPNISGFAIYRPTGPTIYKRIIEIAGSGSL